VWTKFILLPVDYPLISPPIILIRDVVDGSFWACEAFINFEVLSSPYFRRYPVLPSRIHCLRYWFHATLQLDYSFCPPTPQPFPPPGWCAALFRDGPVRSGLPRPLWFALLVARCRPPILPRWLYSPRHEQWWKEAWFLVVRNAPRL